MSNSHQPFPTEDQNKINITIMNQIKLIFKQHFINTNHPLYPLLYDILMLQPTSSQKLLSPFLSYTSSDLSLKTYLTFNFCYSFQSLQQLDNHCLNKHLFPPSMPTVDKFNHCIMSLLLLPSRDIHVWTDDCTDNSSSFLTNAMDVACSSVTSLLGAAQVASLVESHYVHVQATLNVSMSTALDYSQREPVDKLLKVVNEDTSRSLQSVALLHLRSFNLYQCAIVIMNHAHHIAILVSVSSKHHHLLTNTRLLNLIACFTECFLI